MITVDMRQGIIFYDGLEIGHFKWGVIGQTAEVKDIWIVKQYRRKGIGTQVAQILESEFRRMGCRQIEAFRVQPEMGLPFAKALGFTVVRDSFGHYKHMIKAL